MNKKRMGGSLGNFYNAIHEHTKDEEIIVILDGDEWFYDSQTLNKINAAYASGEVWLTHGSLIEYPNNSKTWSIPVPDNVIARNAFRTYRCPSHTRTFYSWLFKLTNKEDLFYKGRFCSGAGDMAQMFPMIEMAGNRHRFIKELTYVYNVESPLNVNKLNAQIQRDIDAYLRSRPPYARLKKAPIDI